jgi:hypothetical protein
MKKSAQQEKQTTNKSQDKRKETRTPVKCSRKRGTQAKKAARREENRQGRENALHQK